MSDEDFLDIAYSDAEVIQARRQGSGSVVMTLTNFVDVGKFYLVKKIGNKMIIIREAELKPI